MNIRGKSMGDVLPEQCKQKFHRTALSSRGWNRQRLSYEELLASFRKGLRNGNWRNPKFLDKALFRASLWYVKHRGSIVNTSLVEKLSALIERLKETKGMRIFERGLGKAFELLKKGEEGVFTWAPQLRYWLKDPDYIFWLGATRWSER